MRRCKDDRETRTGKHGERGNEWNYVPSYEFFRFIQADLQILALLEVSDRDDMAHIIVDGVELGHSINRARQIINKRGKIEIKIRDTYR